MKHFLIFIACLCFAGISAAAKTPPEVLAPYKAYRAALADGDGQLASQKAYEAWQISEERLGDSRMTGDLADNYARSDYAPINGRYSNRFKTQAFERAIELASLHGDKAFDFEVQRRISFAEYQLNKFNFRLEGTTPVVSVITPDFGALESLIVKNGTKSSTYYAELLALKSQYFLAKSNLSKSLQFADESIFVFESVDDGFPSHLRYLVMTFKAESHLRRDELIDAALTNQRLMTEIDRDVGLRTEVSALAYTSWIEIKDILTSMNRTEEMRAAGIIGFQVPNTLKDEFLPLIRVPPIMPISAVKSGHVNVEFDVDTNGHPQNIRVLSSSSRIFERAAKSSVELWRYPPNAPAEKRKGLSSTITFRLTDQGGRLLPE